MSGRPRRTHIYGANYNIGESYYKKAIDNLDRKQYGGHRPSLTSDISAGLGIDRPIREVSFDLPQHKSAFKKALTEEPTLYDFRGRVATLNSASLLDDELDEDVQSTLRKIRDVKKANASYLAESDTFFEDSNRKRGVDVRRHLRSAFDADDNEASNGLSVLRIKKKTIRDDAFESTSAASLRANATKERLANIESDMNERFEKQVQREQRSANLKALLSEADIDTKAIKKVTF